MRCLVTEMAWSMNIPADFVGMAILTLAGAAIANSRHLAITRSHHQSASLYTIIISPPGVRKSAPIKLADPLTPSKRINWTRGGRPWTPGKMPKLRSVVHGQCRSAAS